MLSTATMFEEVLSTGVGLVVYLSTLTVFSVALAAFAAVVSGSWASRTVCRWPPGCLQRWRRGVVEGIAKRNSGSSGGGGVARGSSRGGLLGRARQEYAPL